MKLLGAEHGPDAFDSVSSLISRVTSGGKGLNSAAQPASAHRRPWMPYLPKTLMSCDQALLGTSLLAVRRCRWAPRHELKNIKKAPRDVEITLIASLMESD